VKVRNDTTGVEEAAEAEVDAVAEAEARAGRGLVRADRGEKEGKEAACAS
jgi:hypothetical protein